MSTEIDKKYAEIQMFAKIMIIPITGYVSLSTRCHLSHDHVISHTVLLYIGGRYVPESCDPTHTQYCCILGDIMSLYNLSHMIPHTQYSCLLGDVMSLYNLSHVIPHTQYSCLLNTLFLLVLFYLYM